MIPNVPYTRISKLSTTIIQSKLFQLRFFSHIFPLNDKKIEKSHALQLCQWTLCRSGFLYAFSSNKLFKCHCCERFFFILVNIKIFFQYNNDGLCIEGLFGDDGTWLNVLIIEGSIDIMMNIRAHNTYTRFYDNRIWLCTRYTERYIELNLC